MTLLPQALTPVIAEEPFWWSVLKIALCPMSVTFVSRSLKLRMLGWVTRTPDFVSV